MKPLRPAMDVIVSRNTQPAGIAQHVPNHHKNGKMETAIWHPTSLLKRVKNRRSIRSKLPKEPESNIANDSTANPALFYSGVFFRTYLKNVFYPNLRVVLSFQLLKIQKYSCGLKLKIALILKQNPIFEMGSIG